MDHVVYVDAKAKELELILSGKKTMIIRGATGRKLPYGRVYANDKLYFIINDGSGVIKAQAVVSSVINSDKLDKESSIALVEEYQDRLSLTKAQYKRWAGKRYLVLIGIDSVEQLNPFGIDKSDYANMDDWLPVGDIDSVRIYS
jgi:hypothetical protein